MSDKPEWFKLDPAKFLQDGLVDAMSTEELGATFRLLCRQWLDGWIPDDLDLLARLCRMDRSAMEKAWPILSKFFPAIDSGKRANRFMWLERETVLAAMKKRSDDGREAVKRRWEAIRAQKDTNRSPMPDLIQEEESEEESEPEEEKEVLPPTPTTPRQVSEVLEVWNTSTTGKLPKAKLTPSREKTIRTRLKETGWLDDFRKAAAHLPTDPFNCGQNDRGWVASLDYLLRPGKASEIAERSGFTSPSPHGAQNGPRTPQHRFSERDRIFLEQLESRGAAAMPEMQPAPDEEGSPVPW